jgi:hypothetical protein
MKTYFILTCPIKRKGTAVCMHAEFSMHEYRGAPRNHRAHNRHHDEPKSNGI